MPPPPLIPNTGPLPQPPPPLHENGGPGLVLGVLSIICGLLGFVPVLGLITSVLGVIFGVMGFARARDAGNQGGVVCGIIGLVLSGTAVLLWVIGMLFLGGLLAIFGGILGGMAQMK
ncbi:hypothetical protein C8P66_116112 [Humitalea rosea]|uniref:DUF4190 domain-containing protein n=1 Tax=Humitalea rosea TaxID=990373 RepID=A0A2W7I8C8_9PROT|nr:hypothetical protein [Humitalea rosea]PZW43191.1 hypothetical protein C8P66_116112 [Humitalea rosea]